MKAKKHLGQHFLIDNSVVARIIGLVQENWSSGQSIVEVGPGMGVLTSDLAEHFENFLAIEFDRDMVKVLSDKLESSKIINAEFLGFDLNTIFEEEQIAVVGNFPYNISSQIIFKIIENRQRIPLMVGMFQKEVADRICGVPGNKSNGLLSLRVQAHYKAEKIFDIPPEAFDPPPRVWSSIVVLRRLDEYNLQCDEDLYIRILKTGFQQRRKKLRNTLKSIVKDTDDPIYQKRPEELTVADFVNITLKVQNQNK